MQPDAISTIRAGILKRYAAVAAQPNDQFPYPVGRASARALGYDTVLLERIPAAVVERFVGIGNPLTLGTPQRGWHVVDAGCGAGLDAHVAAHHVGAEGEVIGIDLSDAMLEVARAAAGDLPQLRFVAGPLEALPLPDASVDLVISNGVLNLAACKDTAFREIARVLRPGARLQAADLVLVKDLPENLRNDAFAWSG